MPRRKPTALLEMSGAFQKNPSRKRARAAEPVDNRALGSPPAYFSAAQRVCWGEIERLAIPGVLTAADALAVEMAAVLLERFRRTSDLMTPATLASERRLQSVLSELGMTPAARSRVSADAVALKENPFAVHRPRNAFDGIGRKG